MKEGDRYRNLIVRAVKDKDEALLTIITMHLADTERAKELLVQKGYGQASTAMLDMAKAIPHKL